MPYTNGLEVTPKFNIIDFTFILYNSILHSSINSITSLKGAFPPSNERKLHLFIPISLSFVCNLFFELDIYNIPIKSGPLYQALDIPRIFHWGVF